MCYGYTVRIQNDVPIDKGGIRVKQHKFWAWAAVVCMILAIVTGHLHK